MTHNKNAILGGGDIFFPLLFTGVFMKYLIVIENLSKLNSFLLSLIVVICVTIALSILFYKSRKDKYYPALPFLTLGCFIGFALVKLILFI